MNKKIIPMLVVGALSMGVVSHANATVSLYTNLSDWTSSVSSYQTEDFNDTSLVSGLSYTSTSGGYVTSGYFYDRPTSSTTGTTWSFSSAVTAFGGDFNLAEPGGPGMGLLVTMSDGSQTYVSPSEISRNTNGFWGFVSDLAFTSVTLLAGTQSGVAETYNLDNLVFGNVAAVPEPETYALMGIGLLGLLAARKKRFLA